MRTAARPGLSRRQASITLLRELAHANGGAHVIARARSLELDLVEFADACCHSSHGTSATLLHTSGFIGGRAQAHPRTRGAARAAPRHGAGSRSAGPIPEAAWPQGQTASSASWQARLPATVRARRVPPPRPTPGPARGRA